MPVSTKDLMAAVPKGVIFPWYAKAGSVPSGWAICDGSNGTPDLRQRFLMGVSDMTDVGQRGGANQISVRSTDPHRLTIAEMPSHSHTEIVRLHQGPATGPDGNEYSPYGPTGATNNWSWRGSPTGSAGGDQPHEHTIPPHENRPLFETILFIMKV